MAPWTFGIIGERVQMLLLWVRAMGVGNMETRIDEGTSVGVIMGLVVCST